MVNGRVVCWYLVNISPTNLFRYILLAKEYLKDTEAFLCSVRNELVKHCLFR